MFEFGKAPANVRSPRLLEVSPGREYFNFDENSLRFYPKGFPHFQQQFQRCLLGFSSKAADQLPGDRYGSGHVLPSANGILASRRLRAAAERHEFHVSKCAN